MYSVILEDFPQWSNEKKCFNNGIYSSLVMSKEKKVGLFKKLQLYVYFFTNAKVFF